MIAIVLAAFITVVSNGAIKEKGVRDEFADAEKTVQVASNTHDTHLHLS